MISTILRARTRAGYDEARRWQVTSQLAENTPTEARRRMRLSGGASSGGCRRRGRTGGGTRGRAGGVAEVDAAVHALESLAPCEAFQG